MTTLQLHSDATGLVYYLDGKPVRVGDTIEVYLNGKWITVRFGWTGSTRNDPYGYPPNDETIVIITKYTHVRWPTK
jgi:hypothetical protein